ncbi:class I SAM-dependent methyltransferase [Patescibacteria group bacterium]|nr:class I SAM-dependent methyltransferase [Patescibacteria group bacterium]
MRERVAFNYDSIAEEWDCARRNIWGEFEFARGLLSSKKILDAGCGNGRLAQWLRESGFRGDYLGVDNAKELLKIAKKNFPNEKFELHDLRELIPGAHRLQAGRAQGLMGGSFDAVFCIAVLHHFRNEEERLRVLKNFHVSLQEGGKIFITSWNFFQPKFWKHLFKNFSRDCEIKFAGKGKRFIHSFTKSEMKRLLRQAGFKNIKIFYAKHSKKTNFLCGRNLIALAQK